MRRFALAAATLAVLLLASGPVAAASGWSIQTTPTATGGLNINVYGVSYA